MRAQEKRQLRFAIPRLISVLPALFCAAILYSQELSLEEMPGFKEKAMVLQITTRIEENSQEVWNAFNSKVTIPGRPVSIRLVGDNLVVAIQFTPYIREKGKHVLVAQGQIWLNIPEKGMHYKPTMHSIPMDFGEHIYYFPLGQDPALDNPHIELLLTLYRYGEEPETDPPVPVPETPGETKPTARNPGPLKVPLGGKTETPEGKPPPRTDARPEARGNN